VPRKTIINEIAQGAQKFAKIVGEMSSSSEEVEEKETCEVVGVQQPEEVTL